MKILVVDDSAADRVIIEKMLINDYEVLIACDGLEAMQILKKHTDIKMMILDLNMPNMDGYQVLSILKEEKQYNLRVVILTNYDEVENEIRGLQLGAVDYIRKPIHMESLKVRIAIHVKLIEIQQMLEDRLYENGLKFDFIFEQAPIGIAISQNCHPLGKEGKTFINANSMFEKITGWPNEEVWKRGWQAITHPDDLDEELKNSDSLKSGKTKSYAMEKRFIKPDQSIVWVYLVIAKLDIKDEQNDYQICLIQDITKRKKMEIALSESERNKSVLLAHLPGLAYRCVYHAEEEHEWIMEFVSEGCFNLTGYRPERLLNNGDLSYSDLIAPEYQEFLWNEWRKTLIKKGAFKNEYEIITAEGTRKWVLEMGEGVFDEVGEVVALEGIVIDITERKAAESRLKFNNEHDLLTGLYNRTYLENLLELEKDTQDKKALVCINLNTVESLTTSYGFHYTQALIKKTAVQLTKLCSKDRILFSTYGNRFAFYLKNYESKEMLFKFCITIADQLEQFLASERIGGGIGVVEINSGNNKDNDLLLKNILITSEYAIDLNEREFGICFYDQEMEIRIKREEVIKKLLTKIAAGEKENDLYLNFQPILNMKNDQICGFEALARLNSEQLGNIPPLEFIPIAEKTKLIIPIGWMIFRKAFEFLKQLEKEGYESVHVSVNVSIIQLLEKDFIKNLFKIIDEMQINSEKIGIEITESFFESDHEMINYLLGRLQKKGLKIYIDDFGTGYSSLAREQDLNVNFLKIDKAFIDKLLFCETKEVIAGDIISMAHKLGHKVIAEGVEFEKQSQYLYEFECDFIQGYLIDKPLQFNEAIRRCCKSEKC